MKLRLFLVIILIALLAGCNNTPAVAPTATLAPSPVPTITLTPPPAAATVNGEVLPLADFEAELARLQAADKAAGKEVKPEDQRKLVLDDLIDLTLLAQQAYKDGFKLDDSALKARIDQLAAQMGGASALADWMARNGFNEQSFAQSLRREAAAAWERDKIASTVPEIMEQVHARQILFLDEAAANTVLGQIKGGTAFEDMALKYDPTTGGDLDWFPRGYLTQPDIEKAAFALQPGQVSEVIKTNYGFHIIKVVEKEAERALTAEARLALQHQTIQSWIEQERAKSKIVIAV
jgi:peptidyl-prolyl cis-trans isomerase C